MKFLTCNCIIFLGGLKTNHNWCTQFKYILNVTKVTVNLRYNSIRTGRITRNIRGFASLGYIEISKKDT